MNKQAQGFSLIELLIVVAVVGILAAIVVNSTSNSAEKTRLASAKTVLLELQNKQEQRRIGNNGKYLALDKLDHGATLFINDKGEGTTRANAFYQITVVLSANDYKYTITATPINSQTKNQCGALTVNEKGERGSAGNNCW